MFYSSRRPGWLRQKYSDRYACKIPDQSRRPDIGVSRPGFNCYRRKNQKNPSRPEKSHQRQNGTIALYGQSRPALAGRYRTGTEKEKLRTARPLAVQHLRIPGLCRRTGNCKSHRHCRAFASKNLAWPYNYSWHWPSNGKKENKTQFRQNGAEKCRLSQKSPLRLS